MKTEHIWLIAAGLVGLLGLLWYLSRPGRLLAFGVSGAPPVVADVPSSIVHGTTTPTILSRIGRGAF